MILQEKGHSARPLTFSRSLRNLRNKRRSGSSELDVQVVRDHVIAFVVKLQNRYPFTFAAAYRDLKSEFNKQIQERLAGHFLFGAIGELTALPDEKKDRLWKLGAHLSATIKKGGENFRPADFTPLQRELAVGITPGEYDELIQNAEELSISMGFKLGPVNSAEHVIAWCFRYVRLFFESARWESKRSETNSQ